MKLFVFNSFHIIRLMALGLPMGVLPAFINKTP